MEARVTSIALVVRSQALFRAFAVTDSLPVIQKEWIDRLELPLGSVPSSGGNSVASVVSSHSLSSTTPRIAPPHPCGAVRPTPRPTVNPVEHGGLLSIVAGPAWPLSNARSNICRAHR